MSELKLNLVDAQTILCGTIHGSIADYCVAALSAEPETIAELETALSRYINPRDDSLGRFASFRSHSEIDTQPYDAGLVVIDLAARVVASESIYSQPGPEGQVCYHDGKQLTDIPIRYHLPADWRFVNSVEAYRWSAQRRRSERQANPPLDVRAVLYGLPLIEFIVKSVTELREKTPTFPTAEEEAPEPMSREIAQIHARWLTTRRADLRDRSPRDVMLERQNLIDADMDSRCLQWTFQGEGPPCLAPDSFAYRYAGFGTHEWVVYYDLVRFLLWTATQRSEFGDQKSEIEWLEQQGLDITDQTSVDLAFARSSGGRESVSSAVADGSGFTMEPAQGHTNVSGNGSIAWLDQLKTAWLEQPWGQYDGRIPAILLDNERRRLPITMSPEQMIIDEDCECCQMLARDAEMGYGPTFWHLDGCEMEDEFAFSTCRTIEEWDAEIRQREEFNREFDRKMQKRRERIARGEIPDDELFSVDEPF